MKSSIAQVGSVRCAAVFALLAAGGIGIPRVNGQLSKPVEAGENRAVEVSDEQWATSTERFDPSHEPSIVGCGKAEAAQRWFRADPVEGADGGVAEAMGETDVLHNDLTIEVTNINTVSNSCTITGQNRMTIRSLSPSLTIFTIRLRSQFSVIGAMVNEVTPVNVAVLTTTTRTVTLDRAYGMDEVFTLTISYTGTTVSAAFGSIEVRSHAGSAVVSTLSEPYYAYTWWPVKDGDQGVPGDNSDKATLDMTVTVPNNFSVASNGSLEEVTSLSGGRSRYHWSSDYPIATYLVSFAATNYTRWSRDYVYPGGTMPVEFFIYPENDSPQNRAGWEQVTDMMGVFRPLFGEYPFVDEKYGLYNFPFGGGMEHQTMTGQSGFTQSLTSHELSHQWWGDNVTCKTWSDIWLNEGFATYGECLWEEFKTGSPNPSAYFSAIQARKPSNVGDTVYIPAFATSDVGRIFSSNASYRKGAWVLHMLRHVVGDSTFFQILKDYRAAFEGSAATTDDFAASASSTYGEDLTWFFDEWVYDNGAPTYRFGWDSVNVEGQDYLHLRIDQSQGLGYPTVFVMPVDIAVSTNGPTQFHTVWNDERSQHIVIPIASAPTAVNFDPSQWILRSSLTSSSLVVGDMNGDLEVDGVDHASLSNCFTGAGGQLALGCENADFDGDGDVDCTDATAFAESWTAGGSPPGFAVCDSGSIPTVSEWGAIVFTLSLLAAGTLISRNRRSPQGND